jgi:hypothetical protein
MAGREDRAGFRGGDLFGAFNLADDLADHFLALGNAWNKRSYSDLLPIFLYSSGYVLYSLSVLSRLPEPVSTFYPARAKRWLLRYYAGVGILILAIWVVGLLYFITAAGIKFFSP